MQIFIWLILSFIFNSCAMEVGNPDNQDGNTITYTSDAKTTETENHSDQPQDSNEASDSEIPGVAIAVTFQSCTAGTDCNVIDDGISTGSDEAYDAIKHDAFYPVMDTDQTTSADGSESTDSGTSMKDELAAMYDEAKSVEVTNINGDQSGRIHVQRAVMVIQQAWLKTENDRSEISYHDQSLLNSINAIDFISGWMLPELSWNNIAEGEYYNLAIMTGKMQLISVLAQDPAYSSSFEKLLPDYELFRDYTAIINAVYQDNQKNYYAITFAILTIDPISLASNFSELQKPLLHIPEARDQALSLHISTDINKWFDFSSQESASNTANNMETSECPDLHSFLANYTQGDATRQTILISPQQENNLFLLGRLSQNISKSFFLVIDKNYNGNFETDEVIWRE